MSASGCRREKVLGRRWMIFGAGWRAHIKVRRSSESCIHCGACHRACPMDLDPQSTDAVTSPECLACGQCVEACPVPATLAFSRGTKAFSVISVGMATLGLFFGAYGLAKVTGHWQTTVSPAANAARGGNPAEGVYGWMTLAQVADVVKLPPEKVLAIAGLPADTPQDVSMKKIPGLNDDAVQEALRAHFAASPSGKAQLPSNPDEIRGSVTLEDIARTFDLDPGKILETAGWPADSPRDRPIKEVGAALGKEVSEIRAAVAALKKGAQ